MRNILHKNLKRIIAVMAVFAVFIAVVLDSYYSAAAVYAESSTVTAYENQDVMKDLEGSTIAGVEFDTSNYPYNANGKPQLLNLVEFGYSVETIQSDYGLYVYVYNPSCLEFDDNSELNQIQFSYDGGKSYDKYDLEFLNYSETTEYEGLFYKYKVDFTDSELTALLSALDPDERVYQVSGIELAVSGTPTEYAAGATYIYTGYALGYGYSSAITSTLECTVTNFDTYVTLDVQQTVYYPEGAYYNGDQVQLNSCYFGIPNTYLEDYGVLTNILAEWYEYLTKPILITENSTVFAALYSLYGQALSKYSSNRELFFASMGNTDTSLWGGYDYSSILCWSSNDYDSFLDYTGSFDTDSGYTVELHDGALAAEKFFESFAAVFYTGSSTDYSDYSVSAEDLKSRFLLNSQYLANNGYSLDILGKYCSYLFEDYIDSTGNTTEHVRGYNKLDISADDIVTIYTNSTSKKTFWEQLLEDCNYTVSTIYDDLSVLQEVSYSEIKNLTDSEISANYYINEYDAAEFKLYVKASELNDETVYILRYGCANYSSMPMCQAVTSQGDDMVDICCTEALSQWGDDNYSAYVCKETVYLNFDIISLTFTSDDNVTTVIPVVISPQDVFSDTNPPLPEWLGDSCSGISFQLILGIVLLVLLLIICAPVLPYVVKFVVWIVCLPFKGIAAICKGISNSAKKRRQKKKSKK
ncbi:MAG: hypothetical protein LUD19_02285 [Clostridia bacterium]|nr:hypothetical protein [Clostridia bacterium]